MILDLWAAKWRVPPEAIADLKQQFGAVGHSAPGTDAEYSETAVQTRLRLEAAQRGERLWRNNNGAAETTDGRFIRYGLANDSKRMNSEIKSSDLIGVKPVVVIPEMINKTVGIFKAREVKRPGWKFTGTKRELAQLKFIELINSLGGDAAFTTAEE